MAQLDLDDVGAALRESVSAGAPGAAMIAAWQALNDADPRWQALLGDITAAASQLHPSVGTTASIHPDAIATALVDRHGRIVRSNERFQAWVGDPADSPECRRLIGEALSAPAAIGLVPTVDGRVVSLFAQRRALARSWDLFTDAEPTLDQPDRVLLIAFAPSKSSNLASRAATALGLTGLETRIAEALLDAPNLAVAARSIGVGRETAKDALERAMRKAGARRAAEFVGQIVDLGCEVGRKVDSDLPLLRRALGLTPAEARVAAAIADGAAAREIGDSLGIAEETVKSYRRSIFLKTGVNRSRDLRRVISEVAELDHLASVSEVLADRAERQERLRVIVYDGRRVAFIDYGPASGAPLIVGHGFTTGRLMPPPLLACCHAAGFRVIVPQRPGFGLTDAAAGDYLQTAANDLAAILDSLGLGRVRLMARDGGAATALAFAARHPGRLERPVLLNPRSPLGARPAPNSPMSAISRLLLERPGLIEPFAEMLRRQTRSDAVEAMLKRACAGAEPDRILIEDKAVLAHLVRDMQGLMARSVRGFIAEQQVYADGWSPPGLGTAETWTVAYTGALGPDPDIRPWAGLPGLRPVVIDGAGLLLAFSQPDRMLALLD